MVNTAAGSVTRDRAGGAQVCPMSRGEFYAAIRMLEVFAPADPLITRLQMSLGALCDLHHPGNNQIGHDMAVEVDRLEKMKTAQ